jgi:hypothetical protein
MYNYIIKMHFKKTGCVNTPHWDPWWDIVMMLISPQDLQQQGISWYVNSCQLLKKDHIMELAQSKHEPF